MRKCLPLIVVAVLGGATAPAQPKSSKPVPIRRGQVRQSQSELTAKGVEALRQGAPERAREYFEKALKADPNDAAAHNYLGILDDGAGDLKNAERHFARAARLNPKTAAMRNNYGAILLKLNRSKEAAAEFEASLRLDPKQPNALVNLAQIRYEENSPASLRAAYDLFDRAAALAPDAAVERSLVVIALRLKNKTNAAKHYSNYAAQASADNAVGRAALGGALFEAGLLAEAETELRAALAADSSNGETTVLLGRVHLARNDIKAAGVLLETAVAQRRATAPIYSLLAVVYEKAGHYENAIPAMRLAIDLEPASENYRFQYGLLLIDANAPGAAVIRLDEALKAFPQSPRLRLAHGIANLRAEKYDEAIKSFNRALELDPKSAQAYAYLGLVKTLSGDYPGAVAAFETALAKDASLGVVHQLIAETMLQQSEIDAARVEAELKKSIALVPDFTPAYLTLGNFYVRVQRWPEALGALGEVVRRSPETAEAYYQLGRVYARLKQKKEAEAALAKFKELNESQKTKADQDLREVVRRLADVRF